MSFLLNKAKAATQSAQNAAAERYASVPTLTDATSKLGLGSIVDGVSSTFGLKDPALENPHGSCAPITDGNNVKFHIAGCAYFWALSEAIEKATKSVYIQGLWVSPELYLRRPPAANEQYRLDRMLKAAAERGCDVRVMVWKEMPNTLPLESRHTKHALEDCHPKIQVFRHPDWYVSPKGTTSSLTSMVQSVMKGDVGMDGLKNYSDDQIEKAISLANLPMPGWTHHEKLCVIDSSVAFIGGIDICYGRYDPDAHPIADVHPDNVDETVWPGQDYNNGRIKDFHNLTKWERNDLDRQKSSRMGWEDIALSLHGPSVADVAAHYQHRWNFIYDKKYNTWTDSRYSRIDGDAWAKSPSINETAETIRPAMVANGTVKAQFIRSCSRWSNGTPTEHSVYNAYIETIEKSEHFIYIENQFFVTKSTMLPATIWNKIGEALANRVIRAAKEGKKFKVFVVMPSIMVYPGELISPLAFPARVTMKLNYHSINRGLIWPTLFSTVKRAGVEPGDYFHFHNLRNYDRINAGGALHKQELKADTSYAAANADHNTMVDAFGSTRADFEGAEPTIGHEAYNKYQAAVSKKQNDWDSVSDCYMDSGKDIRSVPWTGDPAEEVDAFVSEQLYVHSKVLIADDRVVICGSANLNDRSMKGSRDSEAALYMEDTAPVETTMDGKPYTARKLAATWRRYLFRKHLGLLKPWDYRVANDNFLPAPVPNDYDLGSANDQAVADPLSDKFLALWQGTAKTNSEAFWNLFEPVPDNSIKTWAGYGQSALKRKMQTSGWGHVLTSKYPKTAEGAKQVKEELAKIRGSLINMSMDFLGHDDIELLWWNPLTQIVSA